MDFKEFKKNVKYIPVPAPVFDILLENISDISDLKLMFRIIWLLQMYNRKPQYVTESEIIADKLIAKLTQSTSKTIKSINNLEKYGVLKSSVNKHDNNKVIFLNSNSVKEMIEKSNLPITGTDLDPWESNHNIPNIYSLYEQNIGMITPHVAELIKEAENTYPVEWIEDAIKHASTQNKRSWAYISSILNRWKIEGKDNGEHPRHNRKTRYR